MSKKIKSILSMLLVIAMTATLIPNVFAAQSNEYVDPADNWITANGRTNELDVNSTTTYETSYCDNCGKITTVLTYRVPEYTKSGTTALNRNVMFSDGTCIDGINHGNLDDGTPGVDAYYTGYHWTKAVCQNCGTINSTEGKSYYSYNKNVYALNSCDHNFFIDYDNTSYTPYNDNYHTTVLKKGQYCKFCKGTFARANTKQEQHHYTETIDAQLGNNRFYVTEHCDDCNYETSEYATAKSVVSSYYGKADGEAHTLTVSDLSDSGVKTSIRYGTSADSCNNTSAPNYTKAGYYNVYYKITYSYSGESMTENGVSYVWLLEDNSKNEDDSSSSEIPHVHDYRYIETVAPSCTNLGYERWQCNGCGNLEKRNYTPMTGHDYKAVTIREANCKQGGLILHLCSKCGDFYEETTSTTDHNYADKTYNPTCRNVGYTEHTCKDCGYKYITDIVPLISHSYEKITKQPTCTEKGYTTYICTMCNESYVNDYTDATGHEWDEGHTVTSSTCTGEGVMEYNCKNCTEKMIKATSATGHTPGKAANCIEPQTCEKCGTVLELPHGHNYSKSVTEPTCTAMGYTTYTCDICNDSYTADFTDKIPHDYEKVVTPATCTEMGFTTYSCKNCNDSYISDYTDKLPHKYKAVVTKPTCTELGYTTYTCEVCGDTYKNDFVDKTEHNYNKQVVEPTCTEHGYSIYICPDCGKEYIGDYTDIKQHHYKETVTPATCTEMGYTTYTCEDCGDTYKGNYTDKIPHDYEKVITYPTCTELGFTTYTCKTCGDSYKADYVDKAAHSYSKDITVPTCTAMGFTTFTCDNCGDTYKAEYKYALGHTPSDWIIDIPATIEHSGQKHIGCLTCGEVLQSADIPQLIDKDNSDEDGKSQIGDYSIILTDKNSKPIFNSEISIDVNDKISIQLPESRLLDFNDQTTITAFKTDTQEAVRGLNIFIADSKNNNATGITDANGQFKVPNDKSSTGDNNGTIGGGDENNKFTYVVSVKNKENIITDNCDIWIGESNNIVVDLPDGVKPTKEAPVIVTVVDHNGAAQADVTVIVLGDADFIEKGKTDIYGRVTLPITNEGYTDENGKVNVDNLNVIVNDELGLIANALVSYNEDGTITVTLPCEKSISYDNRITVTVFDSMGTPVSEISVTVNDLAEKTFTAITDENGRIVIPPINEDYTDKDGKAVVNGLNVLVTDESKPIENAFVTINDGKISVKLPDTSVIDVTNRITVTVTDNENAPVKDMSVTVSDTEKAETNLTDENGKATIPPTTLDYTDINGYGELNGYSVIVSNETGLIEKAYITLNITQSEPDADGKTTEIHSISVKLPENVLIDYANRVTVTILKKADKTPVIGMRITVTDNSEKSATDITDKNGKVIVPPVNEDITDNDGKGDVTDNTSAKETQYIITVNDTKGIITGSFIKVEGGKIYITLPDTNTLTTSNQTTVTVMDKDSKPISNVSVTVTDKDKVTATGTTNSNGQITVPVKPSSGGSSGGHSSGGGGGSYSSVSSVNVKVVDKDNKTVSISKSVDSKGNITVTLPTGKIIDADNYYTITVTDNKGNAKADTLVTLKDKKSGTATGTTDKNGVLTLPASEHKAYIFGYPNGEFSPDGDMTRAEAAAIFARLIAEEKGESVTETKTSFTDVSKNEWYINYISYLEKYNIIKGYEDNTFRPEQSVTRAEFVAMTVRYYSLFNEVKASGYTVKYTDVNSSYWAYKDIAYAKNIGWLNGYADGTFKGDNNITRAEVVTVVNNMAGRIADKDYINNNLVNLNKFTDLKNNSHWGYYGIIEAANTHKAVSGTDSETWVK